MSPGTEPVAVVLGALAAPTDPGLDELLGEQLANEVRAAVRARARRWAREVAGDRAFEATSLDAALAALPACHGGPVLLAAPDIPRLGIAVARDALGDLAAGCDLAVGAAHDSRPYLLAVARPAPELLEVAEESFEGSVLSAFAQRRVVVGMLHAERRLVSRDDALALALDPLAPPDLAALLAPLR